MKKIANLIGILWLFLSACSGGEENNAVHIDGHIQGLGNDTLYLYGIDKYFDRIDTIPVNEGKFSVTLAVDTLSETRLRFGNGLVYPIYLNKGDHIEIKGKEAELPVLEVKGNLYNKELTAFYQETKGLQSPSDKVWEEKAEAFILSHPFSLANIYLLDRYFVQKPAPDLAQIRKLADSMSGELKDRPYITDLQTFLKASEKGEVGKTLPYFRMPNAKGKRISRSEFSKQYLLVHFWASWDSISCQQNSVYRRIYQKEKKNKQFALLGVSLDIDRQAWKERILQDTLKWEQVCDLDGWNTELVKQLGIREIPYNLLLSPSGRIEGKNLDEKAIEEKLKDIEKKEKENNKKRAAR